MKLGELIKSGRASESFPMLLARPTDVCWERNDQGGRNLVVALDENTDMITGKEEDRAHFAAFDKEWIDDRVREGADRIADSQHPLRYVTSDIYLIIATLDDMSFLASVYRDIPLRGWLGFGGHPLRLEELFNPLSLALRELSEELLIASGKEVFYIRDLSEEQLQENIGLWRLRDKNVVPLDAKRISVTKDNLVVKAINRAETTSGALIGMTTDWYGTIFPSHVVRVDVPVPFADLQLYDCETAGPGGRMLNRPVRLMGPDGRLEAIFSSGQNVISAGWNTDDAARAATLAMKAMAGM